MRLCDNCKQEYGDSMVCRTNDGSNYGERSAGQVDFCATCAEAFHAHDWTMLASRNINIVETFDAATEFVSAVRTGRGWTRDLNPAFMKLDIAVNKATSDERSKA